MGQRGEGLGAVRAGCTEISEVAEVRFACSASGASLYTPPSLRNRSRIDFKLFSFWSRIFIFSFFYYYFFFRGGEGGSVLDGMGESHEMLQWKTHL